jgi:hypothetical protein
MTYPQALPGLLAQLQERQASEALARNLNTLQNKLQPLLKEPDKARAYLEQAIQEYHLHPPGRPNESGAVAMRSAGPRTFFEILDDVKSGQNELGLKPLYEVAKAEYRKFYEQIARKQPGSTWPERYSPDEFVKDLFQPRGLPLYVPVPVPRGRLPFGERAYYWRTDDKAAYTLPNRQAVEEKVKKAWYFDKAREVARADAEAIAKAVKGAGADRKLEDKQAESPSRYGKAFELAGISKLWRPEREPLHRRGFEYRPYRVPEDKRDLFPYQTKDLADQLQSRLKKRGDATVIVDAPVRTYYVAVLEDRDDRNNIAEFFAVYRDVAHADLWRLFEEDRRREYRKLVLRGLRAEAVGADKLDKDGRYVVAEEVRQRIDSARGSGEE